MERTLRFEFCCNVPLSNLSPSQKTAVPLIETLDWPAELPEITGTANPRLSGHRREWISAVARGFNHQTFLLRSVSNQVVSGFLPLVLVKGPLFGRFLISLPYVNTGGVCADNNHSAMRLVDCACQLADRLDVRYLELRHEIPLEHGKLSYERRDKMHMRLTLPASDDQFQKSLKSKLRSQIKKAEKYDLIVHWGGLELLSDFYRVFAKNMRDLGTPVFSRKLFRAILEEGSNMVELCIVKAGTKPIAAAILTHFDGITEVPSASSLREFNCMNANMMMYRSMLARAIERGSRIFDFGRSSEGSGTYKFKEQWGAKPHPAVWQYYVRKGNVHSMRPEAPGNRKLIWAWQRLPVSVTRIVGPTIVRGIP